MKSPLCAVAVLLSLLGSAPAHAALVASDDDAGDIPYALTSADRDDPRRGPRLEVKAWPAEPVEASVSLHCSRGSFSRSRDRDFPVAVPPLSRRAALTMSNPDDCWLTASASFEDSEVEGRILLKIFW